MTKLILASIATLGAIPAFAQLANAVDTQAADLEAAATTMSTAGTNSYMALFAVFVLVVVSGIALTWFAKLKRNRG